MYISDRQTLRILTYIALILGPVIMTTVSVGSWFGELLLLIAVVYVGKSQDAKVAAGLLAIGYFLTAGIYGIVRVLQLGLVPWSGFILLWGLKRRFQTKEIVFWGFVVAGALAALPAVVFALSGAHTPELEAEVVSQLLQIYKDSGMLVNMEQAGMTEAQVTQILAEIVKYYFLLGPAFLATGGLFQFAVAHYLLGHRLPFAKWQLPWYAIWGAVLGIASFLLGDIFQIAALKSIGINLMFIYGVIGLFLGLSLAWFFLTSADIPRAVKFFALAGIVLFINIFGILLILLALFDMVFNFRKLPEDIQEV